MNPSTASSPPAAATALSPFLPSFDDTRVVFVLILTGQLLALLLSLAHSQTLEQFWGQLATGSAFIQWTVLSSALVLHRLAPWLERQSPLVITGAIYAITQAFTLAYSFAVMALFGRLFLVDSVAFPLTNVLISSLVTLTVLRYLFVLHRWRDTVNQQAQLQLQLLQARIRPHFLFNSLNAIAGLIPDRPRDAEALVLDLAELFRTALAQQPRISLAAELDLARRYLAIEQQRLGPRLQVEWQQADPLPETLSMPPLLLQPLLENAIYHGIQPRIAGGTVTIALTTTATHLGIRIHNPVPDLNTTAGFRPHGQRHAQNNVRDRLRLAFGDQARFALRASDRDYTVELAIPLETP